MQLGGNFRCRINPFHLTEALLAPELISFYINFVFVDILFFKKMKKKLTDVLPDLPLAVVVALLKSRIALADPVLPVALGKDRGQRGRLFSFLAVKLARTAFHHPV